MSEEQTQEAEQTEEVQETEEVSEAAEEAAEEAVEEASDTEELFSESVLELTWDETKDIAQARTLLQETESQLSRMMIQFEKQKANLLDRFSKLESFIFQSATALKDAKKINPELTYELKLPQNEGEKGYFIRKDS